MSVRFVEYEPHHIVKYTIVGLWNPQLNKCDMIYKCSLENSLVGGRILSDGVSREGDLEDRDHNRNHEQLSPRIRRLWLNSMTRDGLKTGTAKPQKHGTHPTSQYVGASGFFTEEFVSSRLVIRTWVSFSW